MSKIRDLFQKMKSKKADTQSMEDDSALADAALDETEEELGEEFQEEDQEDQEDQEDHTNEYQLPKESFKDKFGAAFNALGSKGKNLFSRKPKTMTLDEEFKENTNGSNIEISEDLGDTGKKSKFLSREKALSRIKEKALSVDAQGLGYNLGQKLKTFHVEIFSPNRRNQIHKTFQVAIIFGSIFIAGKNLALFLKGDADSAKGKASSGKMSSGIDNSKALTSKDINQIKNSGIFKTETTKSEGEVKKPVIAQDIKCKESNRKSKLPIKLINTVVLQDSVKSIASVQVRSTQELTEVREGDQINGMAKIDLIGRQKVVLKNLKDGNCEFIENIDTEDSSRIAVMSPSKSKAFKRRSMKIDGIENKGNEYTIEKSFIKDKMKNISDVLTQARGIQMTNPDGSIAFKIVDVEPGGIFSYLGIQNNDVITQINGKKISNLNEVMSLFGKISNVDKMKITINRNGQEVPLDYSIR